MRTRWILLLILTSGIAFCAYAGDAVNVQVPFAFTVGDTMLPANEYAFITYGSSVDVVKIRNLDTWKTVYKLSNHAERTTIPEVSTEWTQGVPSTPETPGMTTGKAPAPSGDRYASAIFTKYGDKYFLSKVWLGYQGREFPKCQMERKVMAAGLYKPETVTLVAVVH